MDGRFYVDTHLPDDVSTPAAVTLTTSNQIICPAASLFQFPPYYFNYVGKAVRIRCQSQATSGATPGNHNFQMNWGPATSNSGTLLCGVTFTTWAASVTGALSIAEIIIRCRALGTSGSLWAYGTYFLENTGTANMSPNSPAAVTVDLSQNYFVTPQCSRSGSTAETIQMMEYMVEALN